MMARAVDLKEGSWRPKRAMVSTILPDCHQRSALSGVSGIFVFLCAYVRKKDWDGGCC